MIGKVSLTLVVTLVLLAVAEWLWAPHHHPVFAWHHWPGFLALLGLVSCVVVVWLSKLLGKWFLQVPEDDDE
jgi:hypothetical protein